MLSRVANAIYWMSRYLERSDNVARFIRVNTHLMLDLGLKSEAARWEALVLASGDHEDYFARFPSGDEQQVLRFLTFDEANPNSILRCVSNARENARSIRENLPSEVWEAVNKIYLSTQSQRRKRGNEQLQSFLEQHQELGYLIAGYTQDTMEHREAWHFARMGRLLERADKTARLIDLKYFLMQTARHADSGDYDSLEWEAVLKSVSASEMYLKRYHKYSYRDVAQFLLFDPDIPRSLAYCIHGAQCSLQIILEQRHEAVSKHMSDLLSVITETNVEKVLESGIHAFIDTLQLKINGVGEAINERFFCLDVGELSHASHPDG